MILIEAVKNVLMMMYMLYYKFYIENIFYESILLKKFECLNYIKNYSMTEVNYMFYIKVQTFISEKTKQRIVYIYSSGVLLSIISVIDEIPDEELIKCFEVSFLDRYDFIHHMAVFNNGVVRHYCYILDDYYNYKGDKRSLI